MPALRITIENYRNIPLGNPITFEIKDGISFILGMNNVGKSTLLKFFFELRNVLTAVRSNFGASDLGPELPSGLFFDQIVNRSHRGSAIKFTLADGERVVLSVMIHPRGSDVHTSSLRVTQSLKIANKPDGQRFDTKEFLETFTNITKALYLGAFRSIDVHVSGRTYDIDIGQNFVTLWNAWASGDNIDHIGKTDLLLEEMKELFGFKKFGIRVNEQRNTLLVTTDDGTFRLDELGTGISQFIIALGNALIKNPPIILIDEPETGLHPRMQEVFVRALAAKAKHALVASSHSVGLARSTSDSDILSLTRLPNGNFELKPFGEHYTPTISQSINELGYSQFIEIGGDNILLVEGRTEIKCFREILRKYQIETSFIILPLGGSSMIVGQQEKIADELNELKRLNAKSISVIFDSERSAGDAELSARLESFKAICATLGYMVFPTDRHSTENYVTQAALDIEFGAGRFVALEAYENFSTTDKPKWDKNRNWHLFRSMKREDIDATELGKFITEKLLPLATPIR